MSDGRTLNTVFALNALAIAFSLSHAMLDAVVIATVAGDQPAAELAYITVAAVAYGWWAWSLARLGRDGRSGLVSCLALSALWAFGANGGSIAFCPPPCAGGGYADLSHLGSLALGGAAAIASFRLLRYSAATMKG